MNMTIAQLADLVQTETGWRPMNHNTVLDDTMQLMGEPPQSRKTYEYSIISISNRLISELFEHNNAARIKNGKTPFTEYPIIKEMTDLLPYEYEIISNIFVYGIGYWLFLQDDEFIKANAMLAQFENGKNKSPAVYQPVRSVY